MLTLLKQMIRMPFALAGYLFEMAAVTTKGLERLAEHSLREALESEPAVEGSGPSLPMAPAQSAAPPPDSQPASFSLFAPVVPLAPPIPTAPPAAPATPAFGPSVAAGQTKESMTSPNTWRFAEPRTREERIEMADTDLHDDMVKLVEYTIVSIERGNERLLKGPIQVIVTDDLTGNAFSNAAIYEWTEDRKPKHQANSAAASKKAAAEEDRKKVEERKKLRDTLRVYYDVLARWPKEDLRKDETQLNILREIAAKLPMK